MKISTNVAALARAAALASDAIEQKEAKRLRALGAAQIRSAEDGATLTLNNLNFQITHAFAADIKASGAVAVSAETLTKLIEALPKDAEIIIELRDDVAHIKSGRRKFKLPIIPQSELPVDLHIDAEIGAVTLPRADALDLFARTCFAVATPKDPRQYLHGIFLHNVNNELIACATEGHILCRHSVPADGILSNDRHLIAPAAAVEMIARILADKKLDNVMLRRSRTLFAIESTNVAFIIRLIDGAFPGYEKTIPATPPGGATIVRSELLQALERAIATSGGRELNLAWSDGELRLSVADVSDDTVDAEVSSPGSIAIDARKLHALVREIPGTRLTLAAADPREPLRVSIEGTNNFLAILAPRHASGGAP